ncbi:MAG: NUDIX hydrolase [Alphaproteobacteria bacterium]|nr:MAG: NUDIX hydrolase [Alphaproteobacteria bacterium]
MGKNTGHVMLINNAGTMPKIFLIQESNKHWGIFGGGQEETDKSLTMTAVRELHEESLGSLKGDPKLFNYLDYYSLKGTDHPTNHKTFISVNSSIRENDIRVDSPEHGQGFGDIRNGKFFPLYLVLDAIYRGRKTFTYQDEEHKLRYFFAEGIRRNKKFLYELFNKHNIDAIETRHRLMNIQPVVAVRN